MPEVVSETKIKPSRYFDAGSPMRCFLPSCKNLFDGKCHRGDDDRYYCSAECASEGIDENLKVVEPIRKRG
jgi:hypothetical protein